MQGKMSPAVTVIVIVVVLAIVIAVGYKFMGGKKNVPSGFGQGPEKAKAGMMDATGGKGMVPKGPEGDKAAVPEQPASPETK